MYLIVLLGISNEDGELCHHHAEGVEELIEEGREELFICDASIPHQSLKRKRQKMRNKKTRVWVTERKASQRGNSPSSQSVEILPTSFKRALPMTGKRQLIQTTKTPPRRAENCKTTLKK